MPKLPALTMQNTTVRCKCGTRATVSPWGFRNKVVDWQTPDERTDD
ncbi:MAG: hypothetical protein ACT452_17085 [Microthrixaceae bacterium]